MVGNASDAKCFQHDCIVITFEQIEYAWIELRRELEYDNSFVEFGIGLQAGMCARVMRTCLLVKTDNSCISPSIAADNLVAANMCQSGKVHAGKCIEAKGALLMCACSRNDFITKDYDNSAALLVNGIKYRVVEVKFCIGKRICHGLLGTGQHDWLGTILNKIRQSGCGVCHGVGAVQDNKAVVVVVIFDDVAAQVYPIAGTHVGAVDIHGLDKVKRTELIDERNVCNQIFSRYIRSKACCGGDGSNGSPGGND